MALDARRDHHPGYSAADRRLLPAGQPALVAAKRRFHDAERVLLRLRDTSAEAKRELDEIRESLQVKQSGWALFKENSNFRRAVFLGILLQVMQQFTGMNVIMYYAPKIFELAGYTNTTEQMWGTVIVGLTNVLATFIAIGTVDRWGRKPTLTLGFWSWRLVWGFWVR